LLDFYLHKKYNCKKSQKIEKVAIELDRGRPKAEIPRSVHLSLRLTKFEAEKIARVAAKKNLTKTDAILKGIELLECDKPKKFKNLSGKNNSGVVDGDVVMFNKN